VTDPRSKRSFVLIASFPNSCMYFSRTAVVFQKSCCSSYQNSLFFGSWTTLYCFKKNVLNAVVFCSKTEVLFQEEIAVPPIKFSFLSFCPCCSSYQILFYLYFCCRTSWTSRRRSCWRRTVACAPPPTSRWPPLTPRLSRSTQTSSDTITSRSEKFLVCFIIFLNHWYCTA
jgi:hypothetical protein